MRGLTDVTVDQGRALAQVRADWTTLGERDPLWAVLVHPDGRHNSWDVDQFFATGVAEVDAALDRAQAVGRTPGRARALDFGCGVGRLSAALTRHVDAVTGVDISPAMLAEARRLDVTGRCEFVENDAADLARFADHSFDIVFSSLVLQHLPPRLARGYLAEMLRVVRRDGVVIVQVATRPGLSLRGILARVSPRAALRFAQRRLLGYPAPMDMYGLRDSEISRVVAANGGRVLARDDVDMYGGHWRYARYVIARET